jgi:SAM-dependent methyltransferase
MIILYKVKLAGMLKNVLAYPLTRGLNLDDPLTTSLRRQIIRQKPFLRKIYAEWYAGIVSRLGENPLSILELGSGAGFLSESLPRLISSEVFFFKGISIVLDGRDLPFANSSLDAIVMTDVLHHIPNVERLFKNAARCVKPGGRLVMVEPWVSKWSKFVFSRFHHEPFAPGAESWDFSSSGPLSGANGALPWIVFERDRRLFEQDFPMWEISCIRLMMPFCYLLSGGVSLRSLAPGWSYGFWRSIETLLSPWMKSLAMFAEITLVRE